MMNGTEIMVSNREGSRKRKWGDDELLLTVIRADKDDALTELICRMYARLERLERGK